MNLYLLLILLTSWSLVITPSKACDTGVAFTNSVLSVGRSTLANADVALLETYSAPSVERCMEDCCSGKYGACSVASYNKNTTKSNCLHFYCRPLKQCKFLSSTVIDSFTFSSGSKTSHPVPSNHSFSSSTTDSPYTTPEAKFHNGGLQAVEEIATFSDEQVDLKNDNTTIKPRKGVADYTPDVILPKSGIKPRKGVTLEDVPHSKYLISSLNKSNVKPRKGVIDYPLNISSENETLPFSMSPTLNKDSTISKINSSDDIATNELVSELKKLFEDDSMATITESESVAETSSYSISPTSSLKTYATSNIYHPINPSFSLNSATPSKHLIQASFTRVPSLIISSSDDFLSSEEPTKTLIMKTSSYIAPLASTMPLLSAKAHLSMDEPKSLDKTLPNDDGETENEKKYKSSIHLVLSLVFGLLVLFAVLGVVAKRMYDGWQRRDYYRMNYLIDGIYNGYE